MLNAYYYCRSLITAALVTVLLAMLAPTTCCLGAQVGGGGSELRVSRPRPRRPHHQLLPRMKCEGEKTYYVLNRGDCRSDSNRRAGYVTVWSSRTRFQVVAQQTGLNGSHPLGKRKNYIIAYYLSFLEAVASAANFYDTLF